MTNHYRELTVWQRAIAAVTRIYQLTESFPKEETYGLTIQVRKSAVSVPSNVAEGAGRGSRKDFLRFIHMANGSLAELETQLIIARNLGYLNEQNLLSVEEELGEIGKMLYGLRKSLEKQLTTDDSLLTTDY